MRNLAAATLLLFSAASCLESNPQPSPEGGGDMWRAKGGDQSVAEAVASGEDARWPPPGDSQAVDLGGGQPDVVAPEDVAELLDLLDDHSLDARGQPDCQASCDAADDLQDVSLEVTLDAAEEPEVQEDPVAVILEQYGVGLLTSHLSLDEAAAQAEQYGSAVSFLEALHDALNSFLTDGSDLESPLALMDDVEAEDCGNPPGAAEKLLCFMNRPSTEFWLVGAAGQPWPADNGESVTLYWVFFMTIPDLGDYHFWAIVDRSGEQPVYNYGFN
jgi:hypothetical protein